MGEGKGTALLLHQPHTESRVRRGELKEIFSPSDGKFASSSCLGLEIQVREVIHDTTGAMVENS